MGYTTYVYIGAYLEVKKGMRSEKKEVYYHHNTGRKVETKFDPNTGKPNVVRTETRLIDTNQRIYDIENGKYSDDLFEVEFCQTREGYNTFIPHFGGDYRIALIDTDEDDGVINLDLIDVDTCEKSFKHNFRDVIEGFKKLSDDVQVRFGIITYAY